MRFHRLAFAVMLGFAQGMGSPPLHAETTAASKDFSHAAAEAIDLVNRVATMLETRGRAVTFALMSDPHGPFRAGALYAYALDATDRELTMLAHGANAALVGVPQHDIVDADGKRFNDETVALVQNGGTGWVTYRWPNPDTHKIMLKSSYVRMVQGVIIGAGIYH